MGKVEGNGHRVHQREPKKQQSRKRKLSRKIISKVKEMKTESVGELKVEVSPSVVPKWRRYIRSIRK